MADAIYKYVSPMRSGGVSHTMPVDAEVVSVGLQGDQLCIWAQIDLEQDLKEGRSFSVVGTGQGFTLVPTKYHGRVTDGPYEWHVLEYKRR